MLAQGDQQWLRRPAQFGPSWSDAVTLCGLRGVRPLRITFALPWSAESRFLCPCGPVCAVPYLRPAREQVVSSEKFDLAGIKLRKLASERRGRAGVDA